MANIKENKKYHYTYRTTNLINGRYYLGMHSTNRIDDGYLGSGKRLYYELSKYGRDNFKFEILKQFDSREQLVEAEINLITEHDLKNPNCLNLKSGGEGGLSSEEHRQNFLEGRIWGRVLGGIKAQELLKHNPEKRKGMVEKTKATMKEYYKNNPGHFAGRTHTLETIQKMKEAKKDYGKNSANSQYGTCWITNEVENKKIYKGDLIPEGWRLGRKIKK